MCVYASIYVSCAFTLCMYVCLFVSFCFSIMNESISPVSRLICLGLGMWNGY